MRAPGFRPHHLQPGTAPTDTYVNLTATFKNTCKGGDPQQRLDLRALLRTCSGQDPLLQPWAADSVDVALEPLPANCGCTLGPRACTPEPACLPRAC